MKNNMINRQNPGKDLLQIEVKMDSWKQLLNSWMEENILLKNRLSEILRNNFDHNSLEEIEEFQTKFINDDELIRFLKKNVNELDDLLSQREIKKVKMDEIIKTKFENLYNDISISANKFRELNSAFEDFQDRISTSSYNQIF